MATEIEVKVLEVSLPVVEDKLKELGAVLVGDWLMETIIFDYEDRRLLANNSYVRLRSEGAAIKCTYKSPKKSSFVEPTLKIMNEYEVEVSNIDEMKNILLGLGLKIVMHFEKKRKHYIKDNVVFDFDTLPGIPTFLEIEASSENEINDWLCRLGISSDKANAMGPKEVLAHYGLNIDEISEMKF